MKLSNLEFALMNNRVRARIQRALETPLLIGPHGALRGKRVLEVGCGRGVGVEILLQEMDAAEVVGFDLDPKMIALACQRVARLGERARVYVGDAEHIAEPDASFDVIVEYGILHHIPNWRGALAEIARVLKPGGVFYFEDLLEGFVNAPVMYQLLDHPHATQFTGAEFRAALPHVGLALDENWRQVGEIGLLGRAQRVERALVKKENGALQLPQRVHTWYGVNAEVRAAGDDCDIMVEGVAFPHPSLVNRFLRRAMASQSRFSLGAQHEAGHVQTLPFVVLYAFFLLAAPRRHWLKRAAALMGAGALWEAASEAYVVKQVGADTYRQMYKELRARGRLALFWVASVTIAFGAAWFVLRRTE